MVHLGPLSYVEINGQDVTDDLHTSQPWTMDHDLSLLAQTQSRPGDDGWMERRPTGKVRAVCACGYDTGLVERSELPSYEQLEAQHSQAGDGGGRVRMETPFGPREAVASWLRANGIDPDDVPIDGPIAIERESTEGPWSIRYAALLRKDGQRYLDEATGGPAQELRTVPLKIEPPENMQVRRI